LLGSLTFSSEFFREFVEGRWDNLIRAVGIQLFCFFGFHTNSGRRKSEAFTRCGQNRTTIGAFGTDGGGGCNIIHNQDSEKSVSEFEKQPGHPVLTHNV
jgi:hypothetical protein